MSTITPVHVSSNLLLALATAMAPTPTRAQTAEWADQRSEEIQLQKALPVGGGRWAVIGWTALGGSNMLSVRNADGTIAWETIDEYFTGRGGGDVVLLPDSGLLHVGATDGCDYFSNPSRLRRYTPDGTILWERTLGSDNSGIVTMCAKGSTERLAVASEDSVYVMDMNGDPIGDFASSNGTILNLHWQGDSALFLATYGSMLRVDLDGNVLNSGPLGTGPRDLHWDGQRLFALTMDGISVFDPDLNLIGTFPMGWLHWQSAFSATISGLFVNTGAGLDEVASDGSSTTVFLWPELPEMTNLGCAVRGSDVLVVGQTSISGRSTGIIRRLSMAGEAAQHDEDVEVILQVDSSWAEYTNGPYWSRRANITARVVNHGSAPLDDVVVHMWTEVPYVMCYQPGHRVVASDLGLQPGDTTTIPFGIVDVAIGQTGSQAAGFDDICIVALAPNELADRDPGDNTSCVTVEFVLGEREHASGTSIQLSPNPTNGVFTIIGPLAGQILRVRMLDAKGRVVKDLTFPSGTSAKTIDMSDLPSASYMVIVEGEKDLTTARLILMRP